MTEKQAREEGLHFTGIYSSYKDEVKTRIADIRKKYVSARIVLVNVPHSKLSRSGPGMGYSAYACPKYRAYQMLEQLGNIEEVHAKALADIEAKRQTMLFDEQTRYETNQRNAKSKYSINSANH
jgi:hypothetical protein